MADLQDQTFIEFPKIPRLSRDVVITEKIDGTNGVIQVSDNTYDVRAGSRTRWITPAEDNYGFARWVEDNKRDLGNLGTGTHYGEWWGKGINRGYNLDERRFSLFDTSRWGDDGARPGCCHIVPTLYRGAFETAYISERIISLASIGSCAAPGFMHPEGIIIYHTAAKTLFKKTIEKDGVPKTWELGGTGVTP